MKVKATHAVDASIPALMNGLLWPEVADLDWTKRFPAINGSSSNDDFSVLTALTSPASLRSLTEKAQVKFVATESWEGVINPQRKSEMEKILKVVKP